MTRYRHIEYGVPNINQVIRISGVPHYKTGPVAQSCGDVSITDVNHHDYLSRLGHGDVGGPMVLHRQKRSFNYGHCFAGANRGSEVAFRPSFWAPGPSEPLNSTLYGLGGTAIARTIPTVPAVNITNIVAQSIGMRYIPEALGAAILREKVLWYRSLGKEYLNVEFGWLPFVNDMKDLLHAVSNSHKVLTDLEGGSRKGTRVGYGFPEESSHSTTGAAPGGVYSVDSNVTGWNVGSKSYSFDQWTRTWFNGVFRYYLPTTPKQMSFLGKCRSYADHVLGIHTPTLEDIWDAAPWSWLVDWAINVGDVAKNISYLGKDGLYLQYGYIMQHTWSQEYYSFPGGSNCSGTSTTSLVEWKVRYPASPYGFGLTYDGLSGTQKAILAAVGIAHF